MRDVILKNLGVFPKKVDLNIIEINSKKLDGYSMHLIEYNVEASERVQSYLLIPEVTSAKMPAILAIHQHASNWSIGKSEVVGLTNNSMYSYGIDLVKRGYVVIVPDIICFESRQGSGRYKDSHDGQKDYERFKFCDYLVHGSTLQAKTLHDLSVAIDVLCSLEYVDTENIGAIGHSLGGQEAIWIEWYDERIKVGASSCGVSMIEDIINNHILHNLFLYIPNMLEYCDMDEIISDITKNRKLIISSGLRDERHFPLSGIEKIESKNNNDNFISIEFDDEHKFNNSEKETIYKFLDNNLKKQ